MERAAIGLLIANAQFTSEEKHHAPKSFQFHLCNAPKKGHYISAMIINSSWCLFNDSKRTLLGNFDQMIQYLEALGYLALLVGEQNLASSRTRTRRGGSLRTLTRGAKFRRARLRRGELGRARLTRGKIKRAGLTAVAKRQNLTSTLLYSLLDLTHYLATVSMHLTYTDQFLFCICNNTLCFNIKE